MDSERLQAQRELDEQILHGVRGLQKLAPVKEETIANYLKRALPRLRLTDLQIRDRIDYLLSAELLTRALAWEEGRPLEHYSITAKGMDVLDGKIPPPNWKG